MNFIRVIVFVWLDERKQVVDQSPAKFERLRLPMYKFERSSVPVSLCFFSPFLFFFFLAQPKQLLMSHCGNLQPPLHSRHAAPVDPAGLPPRGAEEVKMACVMLTAADGFPKVLNNLCLHCENRKLVSGLYF